MFAFEWMIFFSEIDDKETEQGNCSKWKESLIARERTRQNINLMQLVYEHSSSNSEATARVTEGSNSEDSDDEEFFMPKKEWDKRIIEKPDYEDIDVEDCSKLVSSQLKDWSSEDLISTIRDRFVTGDWSKAARRGEEGDAGEEDEENLYGDFEDLETGESLKNQSVDDVKEDDIKEIEDPEGEERRIK